MELHEASVSPLPVADIRVSRCLSKAIDTFEGDWEKAAEWMHTPNLALNDRKPFEVVQEPAGEQKVLTLLTQVDHGTYS